MNSAFSNLQLDKPRVLHEQVRDHVRRLIRSKAIRPGERLPSTQQLANLLHTHVPTVHIALHNLCQEGLLVRVPRKGTYVAERSPRLTCVGLYYCNDIWSRNGSLYVQRLHGILQEELTRDGLGMDIWVDPRPERPRERSEPWPELVQAAQERKFQALIATVAGLPQLCWLPKLPVPSAIQTAVPLPNTVHADTNQFVELGLRTLIRQRCRSVGLIAPFAPDGPREKKVQPHRNDQFVEHFLSRASDLGLEVRNPWIQLPRKEDELSLGSEQAYGYRRFLQLWQQTPRPDGLVVFDDVIAQGVIAAMLEQRVRVPEELKLAFHKNESIELFCPLPVTFLVNSERQTARALITQVRRQLDGQRCERILLPYRAVASGKEPT